MNEDVYFSDEHDEGLDSAGKDDSIESWRQPRQESGKWANGQGAEYALDEDIDELTDENV